MKNIFVSSTFRDMQAERDLIQQEVLPQLRSKAREYGENINVIDLRWGVDTSELESEEGYRKVLSVCLDGVERSRPYMLIFLGERYGSTMPPELAAQVIERMNSDFKLEDYEISITGLEIEFGVLSQQSESLTNCVVCMRNFSPMVITDETERAIYSAEDRERARKQQELKNRIKEKLQGNVIEYTCDWEESSRELVNFRTMEGEPLSEKLIRVYEEMLQKEAKEELFWAEQEQRIVNALIERKLCDFKGREELIDTYYQKLRTENGVLVLQGGTGSGKTSILCKLIERLRNDGEKVFCFAANHSAQSETAFYFVRQMLYFLETEQGATHYEIEYLENRKAELEKADDATRYVETLFKEVKEEDKHLGSYEEWIIRLKKQIAELDTNDRVYVIIDGIDQMRQEEAVKYLDFIFPYPQVRYVLSANCEYAVPRTENKCNVVTEQIPPLTTQDKKAVLEGLLTASSRNTYKDIQKEVLKKKASDNPLYISMLVKRLNMMGSEELYHAGDEQAIISHSIEVVRNVPDDSKEAAIYLLKEAVERLGAGHGLLEVLYLIGSSRKGLRESDILAITAAMGETVRQLDILRLMHYMDSFFVIHKDGCIDFSHKVIREGVCEEIADDRYVKAIAKRVKELGEDFNDLFWRSEGMYYARLTEDAEAAEKVFFGARFIDTFADVIKTEALADKGEFYCRCMNKMEKAGTFFATKWYHLWQITQVEWEINEKVLRCFISRMEGEQAAGEKNSIFLFHLADSYSNMAEILSRRNAKKESFVYRKKTLDIRKQMAEQFPVRKTQAHLAMEYGKFGTERLQFKDSECMEEAEYYLNESVRYAEEIMKDEIDKDTYDVDMAVLWYCYQYRGDGFFKQEKYMDAADYADKTLAIAKKFAEEKMRDVFLQKSYANKAAALKWAGEGDAAITCYRQAIDAVAENSTFKRKLLKMKAIAGLHHSIADILHGQGKEEEAFSDYLNYLEKEEEVYYQAPTWTGANKIFTEGTEFGNRYMKKRLWIQAYMMFAKALWAAKEVHKIVNDDWSIRELSVAYDNVGKALHEDGKNEKALENYYVSLEIIKDLYKTDQSILIVSDLAICYNNIGYALLADGNWEEASLAFKQALKAKKDAYRLEPSLKLLWEMSVTYENIVNALDYHGNNKASLEYLLGTIITRVQYYLAKKKKYDTCESYLNSASNLLKQYEERTTDATAPKLRALVQETRGDFLKATGKGEEAQILYARACKLLEKVLAETDDAESKEALVRLQTKIE